MHLTAWISADVEELVRPEIASWLWNAMRGAFPDALAATLIPSHPHVITPCDDPTDATVRLNRLLGQLKRKLGLRVPAGRAAPARVIASLAELRRQLRYVDLNACRDGLVACPLAWLWCTHRDVLGAVFDPWISSERLARTLRDRSPGFVERYHAYVSGDPSCRVAGTPPPQPVAPRASAEIPLERVALAAAAATRSSLHEVRMLGPTRTLFVGLAREQGWTSRRQLADRCGCTTRTIDRIGIGEPSLLAAGRLCLGDRRLLRTPEMPRSWR